MTAYVIVEVNVTDPQAFQEYRKMVPSSVEAYGGRYVVRGGDVETLEGEWAPPRMVVLEFESVDRAKAWWGSSEYAEAKALRMRCAESQMIVAEGV